MPGSSRAASSSARRQGRGRLAGDSTEMRPATPERAELGRRGEALAVAHLVKRGLTILARNQRTSAGEIDIVAFGAQTLVFVEVKTRRLGPGCAGRRTSGPGGLDAHGFGWPSLRQRRRLRRLARAWLRSHPPGARPLARELRFDAIRVLVGPDDQPIAVDHLEAAW